MTTSTDEVPVVHAEFECVVPGTPRRRPRAALCRIGHEVGFKYDELQRYCLRSLDPVDIDLLTVAGAVAFADRKVMRHRATGWTRSLALTVPVHDCERWESVSVKAALTDTLSFLTGDTWDISFVPRRVRDEQALMLPLFQHVGDIEMILPYSGGLDSYAELQRTMAEQPGVKPFLVTTAHSADTRGHARRTTIDVKDQCHQASLPVRLAPGGHAEPTYRTRTFLFYSVSGVAWKLAKARAITIPETGTGAIGPSVVPYGNEHPYRSTHPAFTQHLRRFLLALWGDAPEFLHPHVWNTKTGVLRDLNARGLLKEYRATRSCAATMRRKGREALPPHCGICAACLLRRMAVTLAIGQDDAPSYIWRDLEASSLEAALPPDLQDVPTSDNDRDIAAHGVLAHQHLAEAADCTDSLAIAQAAFEASAALGTSIADASVRLKALLAQHRAEWHEFLDRLPPSSWVSTLARGD